MAERLVRASFQILDILKPDRQPGAAVGAFLGADSGVGGRAGVRGEVFVSTAVYTKYKGAIARKHGPRRQR